MGGRPTHLYTNTMLSLCAIASFVESGEKAIARTMYVLGLLASAGLVLNLSRFSPFSSNKYTTLSVETPASRELHESHDYS